MSQDDKNKNIFQQAKDALSSQDEKAALAAAQKQIAELEQRATRAEQLAAQNAQKQSAAELRANQTAQKLAETERQVTQLKADLAKAQSEQAAARTELAAAKASSTTLEQRLSSVNAELQKYLMAESARKSTESAAAAARAQVMAEHTLKADETLSHVSLKYYGSATEPYWRLIYDANKGVIGDNPSRVRPGMVLQIPVLPDSMKKK
jgi:nucleoid-associated protein YgaU